MLDWSKFAVRMEPTRDNLLRLKEHLKTLDHAAMLRGVRAAKHALTYRLDGYTGDDMLPLLLHEMHRVASVPVRTPPIPNRYRSAPLSRSAPLPRVALTSSVRLALGGGRERQRG